MGNLNGASTERLERVERQLAWDYVRRILDTIPDTELAEFIASANTEAFERLGVTNSVISTAIGDPPDDRERKRRLMELFDLHPVRKESLRKLIRRKLNE